MSFTSPRRSGRVSKRPRCTCTTECCNDVDEVSKPVLHMPITPIVVTLPPKTRLIDTDSKCVCDFHGRKFFKVVYDTWQPLLHDESGTVQYIPGKTIQYIGSVDGMGVSNMGLHGHTTEHGAQAFARRQHTKGLVKTTKDMKLISGVVCERAFIAPDSTNDFISVNMVHVLDSRHFDL